MLAAHKGKDLASPRMRYKPAGMLDEHTDMPINIGSPRELAENAGKAMKASDTCKQSTDNISRAHNKTTGMLAA